VWQLVQAAEAGADLVEIRLDYLAHFNPATDLAKLLNACPLPAIVTYRPTWEGCVCRSVASLCCLTRGGGLTVAGGRGEMRPQRKIRRAGGGADGSVGCSSSGGSRIRGH
jgi:hypothetical protein